MAAPRRRTARIVALAASSLVALVAVLPAGGASADTAAEQREVKRKRAEVASQIDTLQASDAQIDAALADIQANVRATQAAMADAQAQMDAATARAEQAERDAAATEARIEDLRQEVVAAAVEAYVDPQGDKALDVFREESANDASAKQALIDATSGAKLDVVDAYRTAQQELEDQRAEAEEARDEAAERRDALAERKSGYDSALSQQQVLADQVSARLNDRLAESQALASLDSQLSTRLAQEQAALAARLAASRPAPSSSGGGSGGGGGSAGGGSTGGGGGGGITIPRPGLATVGGITVASSAAGSLSSLLDAASAAGFNLGGSGYRDSSSQVALRRQHCGTSDYAVYQMPPEQCSPPTAIPGRSKHEQGLAVDFTLNGRTLTRSDAAFQWLMANAGSYGWVNLPSEPWHWSIGGG